MIKTSYLKNLTKYINLYFQNLKINFIRLIFCLIFTSSFFSLRSQVLFDIKDYRNLAYLSVGYNGAFPGVLIGIGKRDYVRLIKREVIGIFDLSLHVSEHFFTRHVLRKGFQMDLYSKNKYRIPFMFATSSISRGDFVKKITDITAEFTVNPGLYLDKYTLALDCKYELIAFRYTRYAPNFLNPDGTKPKNHYSTPPYDAFKIGIVTGLNFKRLTVSLKTGYEKNPFTIKNYLPGYIVMGIGFKFGTKPFEKEFKNKTKKEDNMPPN